MNETAKIPCPFVTMGGKPCKGHIVKIEAYKVDLEWSAQGDGSWRFGWVEPRSRYHLFCSEKGNHVDSLRADNNQMKFYYQNLPDGAQKVIAASER